MLQPVLSKKVVMAHRPFPAQPGTAEPETRLRDYD
jgi:hypothetical protein